MITDSALMSSSAACFHNEVLIFVVPGKSSSHLQAAEVNTLTTEVVVVLMSDSFPGSGMSSLCSQGEQRLGLG